MFRKAQFKLTLFYSTLFLVLFWSFSFGLYEWMDNSFGEGYISQVQQRQEEDNDSLTSKNAKVVTIAGDVALDQLLQNLIILNGVLFLIIPIASWFLAKRTLAPIQIMHDQQKQFVSDASHEMKTPLSIISGEIEVTLTKERTADEYKKTLTSTKEETDRLSKLVENLLFLAKEDQNVYEYYVEPVDILDILNGVVQSLQPKGEKKQITISLITEAITNTPIVKGHSALLHQLFYNLLDNAIIYTQNKGKIAISISEPGETVSIAIHDTGIGIPKEEHTKILNRFYRSDFSRSKTKGYGLGLAIVSSIIKKHGGSLLISSAVKKGSTFTVLLPKV